MSSLYRPLPSPFSSQSIDENKEFRISNPVLGGEDEALSSSHVIFTRDGQTNQVTIGLQQAVDFLCDHLKMHYRHVQFRWKCANGSKILFTPKVVDLAKTIS